MQDVQNKNPKFGALFYITLILILIAGSVFTIRLFLQSRHEEKLENLETGLLEMQSSLSMESIRQYQLQKIITIINWYNTAMPQPQKYEIAEEVFRLSQQYSNLNVDLICATVTYESNGTWNPEYTSEAGAKGLMQIMPALGMFIATKEDITWSSPDEILYNPIYNIRIGCRYLASLIELYDVDGGLAAFNGGERVAAAWIKNGKAPGILAPETAHYIPAIQKLYVQYHQLTL